MIALIQSLEAHVFTFKEVVGYVTIAICMSFSVGFLIAAYTRIFKEGSIDSEWKRLALIPCEDHFTTGQVSTYMQAIKKCREVRDIGLKDAKDMVDAWIKSKRRI